MVDKKNVYYIEHVISRSIVGVSFLNISEARIYLKIPSGMVRGGTAL